MQKVSIQVVGVKSFRNKEGKDRKIVYYISDEVDQNVTGNSAGYFWGDPSQEIGIGEVYDAVLGYDRAGNYGVVDIIT